MKRSTGRILTTHTGTLARPEALHEMLLAVEEGKAVDHAALDTATRRAVEEVVKRQVEGAAIATKELWRK